MFATIRRLAALLGSVLLLTFAPARGGDDGDRNAAQAVISRQLDAFRSDNAGVAFSFAAPQIQQKFADSAAFMAMVKRSYAPVYRPRSTSFGEFKPLGNGFSQAVTVIDSDGQAWNALYSLERDGDGRLRISGCALVKSSEIST